MESDEPTGSYSCDYYMGMGQVLGECSNNGECVPEKPNKYSDSLGKCICNPGFTGKGDLLNAEGMDCLINTTVIKWWWLVLSAVYTLLLFTSIFENYKYWKNNGKDFRKLRRNGLQKVVLYVSAFSVIRITEGLTRFITGEFTGSNLLISLCNFLCGNLFWAVITPQLCNQFLSIIVASAKMSGSTGKTLKDRMTLMKKQISQQKYIVFVTYSMVLCSYFTENPFIQQYFLVAYYIGNIAISIFFVFFVSLPIATNFLFVLSESNPDGTDLKFNELTHKMVVFKREAKNNGYSNTLSTLLFLCPFMWTLISYQMVFGWTLAAVMIRILLFIVIGGKAKKKGNKVGPGSTKYSGSGSSSNESRGSSGAASEDA